MLTTHAYFQGSINKHISRYETTAVFSHPDAVVDVVLVHGLNGHPEKTWTSSDGKGVFWPADLLPQSLGKTRANILVYGYNADVYKAGKSHKSPSDNFISLHAQTLVANLTLYRKSERTSRNPIIFVAHSLGGLLVKRALLYSNDVRAKNQEDVRSIFISTYGIIFLGTPHNGSDMAAWGLVLQRMADAIAPRKVFESEPILLKTLKKENEMLESINNHFLDVYQRFQIHMAHENHKTDVKGTKMLIVDAKSASPQLPGVTYYGIEATHSGMCKFDSTSAPGYRNVSTAIQNWAEEAPPVIRTRWEIEIHDRRARAQSEAAERTHDYNSIWSTSSPVSSPTAIPDTMSYSESASVRKSSTPRPTFVHPDRFRPNSFFKGRQEELRSLHKVLTDAKRRSEGTSAVLIQGIPGAGKTHLARQYVFNHKDDYPGGIYWIRSTTLHDMEDGFWRIAKTEAIRGMTAQEEKKDLLNPQKMVEIVRDWFNESENWLLVFDGIRFGDNAVLDFIPDRPNSSLIYTSTERAEPGAYRLDNPSIMKLGLLPVQDAQELLLEEMGKKQPYTTDDLKRAQDLVQLMGRLPLMIHAAALQMNATREPLAKYLKSFKDTPRVGNLPAYKTIRDQLQKRGDVAALNLIYILSFFSQSMPVEMLALGLKALDKRTPVKTETTRHKKSLTQTFVTLINFAIIERNETDDIPSSGSQSSHQSVELIPEPLDTIRVHSIVQAFFTELLAEEGQLEFWLERAVRVYCRSLDEANARMGTDPNTGLPDDYRQYVRHGKKLMDHLDRHGHSHTHHKHKAREQPNSQRDNPADLVIARVDLEERLAKLPREIDELQKAVSTDIVDGNMTAKNSSVFERMCSISSQSTDASNGADLPNHTDLEDVMCDSPLPFVDPNHFHMPYRSFPEDHETRAEDERSEDRTITPYPPDVVEGYPSASESGWTLVSKHRSYQSRVRPRPHHATSVFEGWKVPQSFKSDIHERG
ncbi:lipa and NB-ARC domain-containing protein [Colletotrichum eremochloae]|nr:lipa and NB-ARC domain-containing protein [Colletotrichum eremochloae]